MNESWPMSPQEFGAFLRTKREALVEREGAAFGLRRIAETLGVSAGLVSRLETRGSMQFSPTTLARLFGLLGLDRWEGFARAGVADPELVELVKAPSRALAAFLREGSTAPEEDVVAAFMYMQGRRKSQTEGAT